MKHCQHQSPYWNADTRCSACGHRTVTSRSELPRRTREYLRSPWTWPLILFEITGRLEARLRGNLAREGKLPL